MRTLSRNGSKRDAKRSLTCALPIRIQPSLVKDFTRLHSCHLSAPCCLSLPFPLRRVWATRRFFNLRINYAPAVSFTREPINDSLMNPIQLMLIRDSRSLYNFALRCAVLTLLTFLRCVMFRVNTAFLSHILRANLTGLGVRQFSSGVLMSRMPLTSSTDFRSLYNFALRCAVLTLLTFFHFVMFRVNTAFLSHILRANLTELDVRQFSSGVLMSRMPLTSSTDFRSLYNFALRCAVLTLLTFLRCVMSRVNTAFLSHILRANLAEPGVRQFSSGVLMSRMPLTSSIDFRSLYNFALRCAVLTLLTFLRCVMSRVNTAFLPHILRANLTGLGVRQFSSGVLMSRMPLTSSTDFRSLYNLALRCAVLTLLTFLRCVMSRVNTAFLPHILRANLAELGVRQFSFGVLVSRMEFLGQITNSCIKNISPPCRVDPIYLSPLYNTAGQHGIFYGGNVYGWNQNFFVVGSAVLPRLVFLDEQGLRQHGFFKNIHKRRANVTEPGFRRTSSDVLIIQVKRLGQITNSCIKNISPPCRVDHLYLAPLHNTAGQHGILYGGNVYGWNQNFFVVGSAVLPRLVFLDEQGLRQHGFFKNIHKRRANVTEPGFRRTSSNVLIIQVKRLGQITNSCIKNISPPCRVDPIYLSPLYNTAGQHGIFYGGNMYGWNQNFFVVSSAVLLRLVFLDEQGLRQHGFFKNISPMCRVGPIYLAPLHNTAGQHGILYGGSRYGWNQIFVCYLNFIASASRVDPLYLSPPYNTAGQHGILYGGNRYSWYQILICWLNFIASASRVDPLYLSPLHSTAGQHGILYGNNRHNWHQILICWLNFIASASRVDPLYLAPLHNTAGQHGILYGNNRHSWDQILICWLNFIASASRVDPLYLSPPYNTAGQHGIFNGNNRHGWDQIFVCYLNFIASASRVDPLYLAPLHNTAGQHGILYGGNRYGWGRIVNNCFNITQHPPCCPSLSFLLGKGWATRRSFLKSHKRCARRVASSCFPCWTRSGATWFFGNRPRLGYMPLSQMAGTLMA